MSKGGKEKERIRAFDGIVSAYEGALLRYASRLVRHHDAAQNIVQDAFIKLYRGWDAAMEPSARMLNWLYRVTHNLGVDHLRREARLQSLHLRQAQECEQTVPPDRGENREVSDDAAMATAALKHLSLREQQLVILKIYEDKSYLEISEITGLTVGNVGYILHHAMKKMAEEFGKAKAI